MSCRTRLERLEHRHAPRLEVWRPDDDDLARYRCEALGHSLTEAELDDRARSQHMVHIVRVIYDA